MDFARLAIDIEIIANGKKNCGKNIEIWNTYRCLRRVRESGQGLARQLTTKIFIEIERCYLSPKYLAEWKEMNLE